MGKLMVRKKGWRKTLKFTPERGIKMHPVAVALKVTCHLLVTLNLPSCFTSRSVLLGL